MPNEIKNQHIKDMWVNTIPLYGLLIAGLVFLLFSFLQQRNINESVNTISNLISSTTGVIIEYTGSTDFVTGVIIEIPSNPRDLLDYQIEYGTGGFDYIIATPTNQPIMNGSTSDENNKVMHNYLYQNRLTFNILDINREGYIMFVTEKPIKNISNIFIGLNGSTIGWLDKYGNDRIVTNNETEFLYPLDNINLLGNNEVHFSTGLSNKNIISINAVVGEKGNKIEKIIIFFR